MTTFINTVDDNSDNHLYEMSDFGPRTTGLPDNIVVWTRSDSSDHGHNRYRVKVKKNREWAGIFTVGVNPLFVKNINNSLTVSEARSIIEWVQEYSSLIISLIDGKIGSDDFVVTMAKLRG
jgi:hypothetical protein